MVVLLSAEWSRLLAGSLQTNNANMTMSSTLPQESGLTYHHERHLQLSRKLESDKNTEHRSNMRPAVKSK